MIDRAEIEDVALQLSVAPTDVERDYVNGWMLAGLSQSPLRAQLVLKGGNALRKGYFANTRYSKDLDFSTPGSIDRDQLCREVESICRFVTERTGVDFVDERLAVVDKKRIAHGLEVLEVKAYFRDFYGARQSTQLRVFMDVTEWDSLSLAPVERPIIHAYSDAAACAGTVRMVALEEILATKLKCLLQRRHVADLFDYMRWLFFEDAPVVRVLRLDDRDREVGPVVEDVVGELRLAAADELAADDHAPLREVDVLPDLNLYVPPRPRDRGGDELRTDVALGERSFVHRAAGYIDEARRCGGVLEAASEDRWPARGARRPHHREVRVNPDVRRIVERL